MLIVCKCGGCLAAALNPPLQKESLNEEIGKHATGCGGLQLRGDAAVAHLWLPKISKCKAYSLEIVAKDQDAEGKPVGTCEGGTKKIIYRRTSASTAAQSPAKDASPVKDQSAAKEPEKP